MPDTGIAQIFDAGCKDPLEVFRPKSVAYGQLADDWTGNSSLSYIVIPFLGNGFNASNQFIAPETKSYHFMFQAKGLENTTGSGSSISVGGRLNGVELSRKCNSKYNSYLEGQAYTVELDLQQGDVFEAIIRCPSNVTVLAKNSYCSVFEETGQRLVDETLLATNLYSSGSQTTLPFSDTSVVDVFSFIASNFIATEKIGYYRFVVNIEGMSPNVSISGNHLTTRVTVGAQEIQARTKYNGDLIVDVLLAPDAPALISMACGASNLSITKAKISIYYLGETKYV